MGGSRYGMRLVVCAGLCTSLWGCRDGKDPRGADCRQGEVGCVCVDGKYCDDTLVCFEGACLTTSGELGSACGAAAPCESGLWCDRGVCATCTSNERGCACGDDRRCAVGLTCVQGTCVAEPSEALVPPADPACYTPCNADAELLGGARLVCSPEGLLTGCLGELRCVRGSCVADSRAVRCEGDSDCPDFQACMRGECMANCARDSDCPDGLGCYRKVCRLRCNTRVPSLCTSRQTCTAVEGDAGYCTSLVEAPESTSSQVAGTFAVDHGRLELSNAASAGRFVIVNDSPAAAEFVISRRSERRAGTPGAPDLEVRGAGEALVWLGIDRAGRCTSGSKAEPLRLVVDGDGGTAEIEVCEAAGGGPAWTGTLEVRSRELGARTVELYYAEQPDGQWAGTMHRFASFETRGLAQWMAEGRPDRPAVDRVFNAFVRRWAELKFGRIGWNEFRAVMQATNEESWRWPSVQARCAQKAPGGACYLYDVKDGVVTYTSSQEGVPVPSGVVSLPFTMNIQKAAEARGGCGPTTYRGRIESTQSLQYPGNPAVTVTFAGDPTRCGESRMGARLLPIVELEAQAFVGGRYLPEPATPCAGERYVQRDEPWLVPGFLAGVRRDGAQYVQRSCRDALVPFREGSSLFGLNTSLAAANPIPDGLPRVRVLRLVDGALVDQKTMVVLFEEVFPSLLREGEDVTAYGYLVLERMPATLGSEAYEGMSPSDDVTLEAPARAPAVACTSAVVTESLGAGRTLASVQDVRDLVETLLVPASPASEREVVNPAVERVHYLCIAPGGKSTFGNTPLPPPASPVEVQRYADAGYRPCPGGSTVVFFTRPATETESVVTEHACNRASELEACRAQLDRWLAGGSGTRLDLSWKCQDDTVAFCDDNRWDLRAGKQFFRPKAGAVVRVPLWQQVEEAFRYKTRFRARDGLREVGFSPSICRASTGEAVSYCYDPVEIERVAARVDCALALYRDRYAELHDSYPRMAERLREFLLASFVAESATNATDGVRLVREGFEYLWTELLVMLGDDAYAAAFTARLQAAGEAGPFAGDLFEPPNGVKVQGGAGFELEQLYRAAQYYQMALDRFYRAAPIFRGSAQSPSLVTLAAVATYHERLLGASTHKSRAWAEVARRYQNLNRADVARIVVERAYVSAYLESVMTARLTSEVLEAALPAERAQLRLRLDEAQRRYRVTLREMRDVYQDLSSEVSYFGFPPDYVEFPAIEPPHVNAFRQVFARALDKLATAAADEAAALADARRYEVDRVAFESQLATLDQTYRRDLQDLCGTFEGRDGKTYTAVSDNAGASDEAFALGNPCGFMGTGRIFQARAEVALARHDIQEIRQRLASLDEQIAIERRRVAAQCGLLEDQVAFEVQQGEDELDLQGVIAETQAQIEDTMEAQRHVEDVGNVLASCSPTVSVSWGLGGGAGISFNPGQCIAAQSQLDSRSDTAKQVNRKQKKLRDAEEKLRSIARDKLRWRLENNPDCALAQIDSEARTANLALEVLEVQLAAVALDYRVALAISRLESLQNEAAARELEWREARQMAVDVEAARNDPNVRIYKNDVIERADRSFREAVRAAYRATKIYEYYSSTSYADGDELFLVRMVNGGNPSLRSYLEDLEDAYDSFGARYGNPELRVAVVSLRDDVMMVARLDEAGRAVSHAERVARFREALGDVRWLDAKGALRLPFSLRRSLVSPLTANHKILRIEAELEGDAVGDEIGRVYVEQRGTSAVVSVTGDTRYYALPELTANVNTSFNGKKYFDTRLYESERLRDRPLLNTRWDVVLDQRAEQANFDIELGSLSDVRLFFYYTDLTYRTSAGGQP